MRSLSLRRSRLAGNYASKSSLRLRGHRLPLTIYYVGSDNAIHVWMYTTSWQNQTLGGSVAVDTSPVAFRETDGRQSVYYVGSEHAIHLWLYTTSWQNQTLGGSAAVNSSPDAALDLPRGS